MRTESELLRVKDFVDSSYNNFGNKIYPITRGEYLKTTKDLGFCYKDKTVTGGYENNSYWVVCAKTGNPELDLRILMHEYGHIYLGHLDGIHEDLDRQAAAIFENNRDELIQIINEECGIDFANDLIEKVIDDPVLNHSIHNIAMDMEVNTKILSKEDVEFMETSLDEIYEKKIQSLLPKEERAEVEGIDKDKDKDAAVDEKDQATSNTPATPSEVKDEVTKKKEENHVKLILPERYEFESGRSYPEYFIESIKHLDKFVKMMVSISLGGNGDTKDISSEQVKEALDSLGGGIGALEKMMESAGMDNKKETGGATGQRKESDFDPSNNNNIGKRDHGNDSRDEADQKRKEGKLNSGIGNFGGGVMRITTKADDDIELAIEDVIRKYKKTVYKVRKKKDIFYNYNRGISKKIIVPAYVRRVTATKKPSIVYLIDVSGSMRTSLIDRVLTTIAKKMKFINGGLHYDIISWNTDLCQHIKNIKPGKVIPKIHSGGGTRLAKGIEYFAKNYGPEAVLIIISDFEDYLDEWHKVEETLNGYTLWGFNYGGYINRDIPWKNLKVKDLYDDR